MKLAMEIPIPHLEELSEVTDFDYALAHKVLEEDKTYNDFYIKQGKKGRDVWLDNSYVEGHLLSPQQLILAAEMINPTHIVAPEELNNPHETYRLIKNFKEELQRQELSYKIVGSWMGFKKDLELLENICDIVALPWKKPRSLFLDSTTCRRYHYFGFKTLDEIRLLPPRSMDTSRAIKGVYFGVDLLNYERRVSLPPLDFNWKLTPDQIGLVKSFVRVLREATNEQPKG